MTNQVSPEMGRAALSALIKEHSPLGPLKVMAREIGRYFQIPIPGFRPFVVFGPDANRKILVTERNKVLWRNTDPVTDLLRRGILVTDNEEHDLYRDLMEPSLHPSVLGSYKEMMIEQTNRVSSRWKDGEIVDMLVESRKIALLIIMQALFSKDVWDDLPRIWTPILKAIQYISPGPWIFWRKMPRPGYKRPLKILDDYLYRIIADRRQLTMDHKNGLPSTVQRPNDLLQHLIDAGLTDYVIRDQMLTMLIAGHDTSTALLAWTFALLGQHPEIHARLVEEVDALDKSPLLDQVIKESLRLYPPIHIGNRRVAEKLVFDEGNVPAGERMFYSIYLTHRDPTIWEHAEQFCPERFAHGRKTPPFSYVPFGGGPRACIGAAFGQAEARIVLTHLLQTHRFEFTNHKIHAHMGATLEPRPGVRMRVSQRNPTSPDVEFNNQRSTTGVVDSQK
ncbi:MAG TPA: cytochrome P450 [Anaerolineales bacterium]|nr:cytochrome P450 [Anaerolineales bacterium]